MSAKNGKLKLQFSGTQQNSAIKDFKKSPGLMSLKLDSRVRIRCKRHESMALSCLVSAVQAAAGGVIVLGIFSWYTLGPHHSLPENCC